jgi:calcium/proton exchanger cax
MRSYCSSARAFWPSCFAFVAPERHIVIFGASVLAIVPSSAYMGRATEKLAERLGEGIGGLLNATFGNAAELIIGAAALHAGLIDLVKASITGSILGNILLVFGASAFVGGLRRPVQRFNRTAAALGTPMLLLSAIGLVVPAVFHRRCSTGCLAPWQASRDSQSPRSSWQSPRPSGSLGTVNRA